MKEIRLTRGDVTLVDDEDYELLSSHRWFSRNSKMSAYAVRWSGLGIKPSITRMHRVVAENMLGRHLGRDEQIDHINGDTLDNRRANIRVCNHSQNQRNRRIGKNNRSGFKGVSWKMNRNCWQARLRVNKKEIYLGCYLTAEDAARAYNEAAKKYHGEFARLNDV